MTAKLGFVIAGTQKGGTTTLDALLRLHPEFQMASKKETHFFDDETQNWENPSYELLNSYFPTQDDRLRGEATPITMYWQPAVGRLHAYNPDIKLVLLLRDPISRAYSNWQMECASGIETMLFSEAIREGRRRIRTASVWNDGLRHFGYVERGQYGKQLSYLLKYFPRGQIHCEISEDFFHDQRRGVWRILDFLGAQQFPEEPALLHANPAADLGYPSRLTAEDVACLSAIYRPDVEYVESFLGRAVPQWQYILRSTSK